VLLLRTLGDNSEPAAVVPAGVPASAVATNSVAEPASGGILTN
jgi:hypothetical protein